jgi:Uma2 family endonuclease
VVLQRDTVAVPDAVFVAARNARIVEREGVFGSPDLIVEVLSPSTARIDRTRKSRLYARAGVKHYWLLDPDEKTLVAYVLSRGKYQLDAALDSSDTFEPALFPGLRIDLAEVFE